MLYLRNHLISQFLHCRYKYAIGIQGWEAIDKPDSMVIGLAVHAGLAKWTTSSDQLLAHQEALKELEVNNRDDLTDQTFLLMESYMRYYETDLLIPVSAETEFDVEFRQGVVIGMRVDGLVTYESDYWLLERKTTGMAPGNFWPMYEINNRQSTEYLWGARKRFGVPIKGVVIDALFRPNNRSPQPKFRRQFMTHYDTDWWYADTQQIVDEIERAHEKDGFYRSWACFARYNRACSLLDHCTAGGNVDALKLTHIQVEKKVGIIEDGDSKDFRK